MKVCVFIGPTLAAGDARALCPDVVCLPPVRQGDVYRVAAGLRPDAIGIVDGYFSHVPSVWHKEILCAMTEGIRVYGSASMGALRAAELVQFGMVGVGRIFEAYQSGLLQPYDDAFEDDDEVAVLHGPAELGYLALSAALVNIRCTFARATEEEIIAPATRDCLVGVGKALFYQERSYEAILSRAGPRIPADEIERLRAWLPAGTVDQKRTDAVAMMQTLRTLTGADHNIRYVVAETTLWERAKVAVDAEGVMAAPELEELRLQGTSYLTARARALDHLLEPGRDQAAGPAVLEAAHFSRQESADREQPTRPHDDDAVQALLSGASRRRARQMLTAQLPVAVLERHILAELSASGEALALRRRAEEKRRALAAMRLARPVPTDDLIAWYFERLGTPVPADLGAYVRDLDFPSSDAFHRSLLDEYLFSTASEAGREAPHSVLSRSELSTPNSRKRNVDRAGFEA